MESNTKKSFDPTVSFMFLDTWVETIEEVKKSIGVEAAYKLFTAIGNYSMYAEQPDFSDTPILNAIWITMMPGLKNFDNNI